MWIDEGRGDPIVLLHGAPFTSLAFANIIRPLRHHGRVIAPDLPGFGGSVATPGFDQSLASHARFVIEFCEHLELRNITLFVNDTSGPIGLAAAIELAPRLAGLVVADTAPMPLGGRAAVVRLFLKHVVGSRIMRRLNGRTNLLPWLVANVAPLHRRLPKRMRLAMTRAFRTRQQRGRVIDLLHAMSTEAAFLEATATRAAAVLASLPVLVLFGQFDPMRFLGAPAFYRRLLPRSESVIIPREEHFPILGSGEAVAGAIQCWRERMQRTDLSAHLMRV